MTTTLRPSSQTSDESDEQKWNGEVTLSIGIRARGARDGEGEGALVPRIATSENWANSLALTQTRQF